MGFRLAKVWFLSNLLFSSIPSFLPEETPGYFEKLTRRKIWYNLFLVKNNATIWGWNNERPYRLEDADCPQEKILGRLEKLEFSSKIKTYEKFNRRYMSDISRIKF
jgi:hypothetical protein